MLNDFISLLFPKVCYTCGGSLVRNEADLCTFCLYGLPKTNFHNQEANSLEKVFYGRAHIHSAGAYYYFSREGRVQHLIHQLKYKGCKEIGYYIGKLYGLELKTCPRFNTIDVVLPVPLHLEKHKKRGYNQSEYFAQGIAASLDCELNSSILFRKVNTETQTRKNNQERWENVEKVFDLTAGHKQLEGKHILLVDDVITTGATIEACCLVLNAIQGIKISVAGIAYAL